MMNQESEVLAIDLFLASRNAQPVHVPGNFETDSHSYISYLKAMNKLQSNAVPYIDAEEQEWLNDLKASDNSATSEITESFDDMMLAVESLEDEDEMIPEIVLNAVHSADLLISPPRVLQCDNFVVSSKENVLENSEDEEDESSGYVFTTDREKITPTSVMESDIIVTSTIQKVEDLDSSTLLGSELQDQDSELLLQQLLSATQPINEINHKTKSNNQHNNSIDSDSDDDMFSSQSTTRITANHFRHRYLSTGNGVDTTSATVPGVGTNDIEDIVISDTDSDVEGDDTCDSGSKHSTQKINGAHIHDNKCNHNLNSSAVHSNRDNSFNNNIDISHILSELNGQFTDDYIKHKLSTHTTSNSGIRYLQPTGPTTIHHTTVNAHVGAVEGTRFYEDVMPFDDGESLD